MKSAYRPEIDGIRAIAVLAVVLNHAGLGVSGGFVGVDIFFVISGYLITHLLHAEWAGTGRIDLIGFYARRVRRLMPGLVAVIFATMVIAHILVPDGDRKGIAQSAAASFLFTANFFFENATRGYFRAESGEFPFLHLWSLAVEEQFYLIWPLTMIVVLRFWPRALGGIVIGLLLASLAYAEASVVPMPNAAFFQMPARFWELALGGAVALFPWWRRAGGKTLAMLGLAVTLAATVFTSKGHFPGVGALPATVGTAMLLIAISSGQPLGIAGRFLASRYMVYIGLISYSLYLWHWPLLVFNRLVRIGEAPIATRIALCVLAVALAALSYRFVETPFRRGPHARSSGRAVSLGVLASVALAFLAVTSTVLVPHVPSKDALAANRAAHDIPPNFYTCHEPASSDVHPERRPACLSKPGKVGTIIWGDSMGLAWQPFAWAIAAEEEGAVASYTRDACGPLLDYASSKRPLEARQCLEFNQQVMNKANGIERLVLVARWQTNPGAEGALEATIRAVSPHVKEVLLIGPTPVMKEPVPKCISLGKVAECAIDRGEFDSLTAGWRVTLSDLSKKFPNVTYVEPADFFCTRESCPAMKNGYGLYWDANHVSTTAARNFGLAYLERSALGQLAENRVEP